MLALILSDLPDERLRYGRRADEGCALKTMLATFVICLDPPLADAVLFLSFPTSKNAISLGPFVTNQASELSIGFHDLDEMAKAARSTASMDYGPELPSAADVVTIEVESRHSIILPVPARQCPVSGEASTSGASNGG